MKRPSVNIKSHQDICSQISQNMIHSFIDTGICNVLGFHGRCRNRAEKSRWYLKNLLKSISSDFYVIHQIVDAMTSSRKYPMSFFPALLNTFKHILFCLQFYNIRAYSETCPYSKEYDEVYKHKIQLHKIKILLRMLKLEILFKLERQRKS